MAFHIPDAHKVGRAGILLHLNGGALTTVLGAQEEQYWLNEQGPKKGWDVRSPSGYGAEGGMDPSLRTFHGAQAGAGHIPPDPSKS